MSIKDKEKTKEDLIGNLYTIEQQTMSINMFFFVSDFMVDIFGDSQRQFDNTFTQTYGSLYERNAYLFHHYFQELKKYYHHGNTNLFETTSTLFSKLYQVMFQVS